MTTLQPPRYHIDAWDEMMMDRDKRLTGHIRGQTVRPLRMLTTRFKCANTGAVKYYTAGRICDEQRVVHRAVAIEYIARCLDTLVVPRLYTT